MTTSLPTHSYPTVAKESYGFELGVSGEHYFDLSAFLNAESFDEWDMEFAQSAEMAQSEDRKLSERVAAVNTDPSALRDTDLSTRPHYGLLNAGGPPNQLLSPALLQDQHLRAPDKLSPASSPGAPANNTRPSLTFPWSVRDDTPGNFGTPQLSSTGASTQSPNLVPSSSQADRDRGLNKAQRRELAAMRIKICKRCGVYVPGPRRLHDEAHCVAFDKENIDPN